MLRCSETTCHAAITFRTPSTRDTRFLRRHGRRETTCRSGRLLIVFWLVQASKTHQMHRHKKTQTRTELSSFTASSTIRRLGFFFFGLTSAALWKRGIRAGITESEKGKTSNIVQHTMVIRNRSQLATFSVLSRFVTSEKPLLLNICVIAVPRSTCFANRIGARIGAIGLLQ